MCKLSEEIYELLGDCCLARYVIERDAQHKGQELPEIQHSYQEIFVTLIGIIKRHNSFIQDSVENMGLAKALESLMFAVADVFSFFNKREKYDDVVKVLQDE